MKFVISSAQRNEFAKKPCRFSPSSSDHERLLDLFKFVRSLISYKFLALLIKELLNGNLVGVAKVSASGTGSLRRHSNPPGVSLIWENCVFEAIDRRVPSQSRVLQ